ncbi:UNVERIFIED_CONTAM: lipocalin-like domain-containing protein [Prevotella sp. 15_C9]
MNKTIFLYPFLFFLILSFSACSFETDNAPGELEGTWRLISIETEGRTVDYLDKNIFWSFQGKLLQLETKGDIYMRVLYYYKKDGNALVLSSPYRYDRENGDELITDPSLLEFYAIDGLEVTFTFQTSKDKLLLREGNRVFKFVKF